VHARDELVATSAESRRRGWLTVQEGLRLQRRQCGYNEPSAAQIFTARLTASNCTARVLRNEPRVATVINTLVIR